MLCMSNNYRHLKEIKPMLNSSVNLNEIGVIRLQF